MGGKLGLIVITILAVGFAGYLLTGKAATPTPSTQSSRNETSETVSVNNGRYVSYSKEAFEGRTDKRRVLYFHANWCPVCRPLDREFMTMIDKIPPDLIVFKTDYDTEASLKQKYAITYQHTFVQVDADGNEVTKWSGGNIDDLLVNIK